MRTLVLGGIRSGKSRWAEQFLAGATPPDSPICYVATGDASADGDFTNRVAAHRLRRPAHWRTVETAEVATQLRTSSAPTLVDDLGGWLVAAMDRQSAWTGGSVHPDVTELTSAVAAFEAPLALVSPEVGLTVVPATASGRLFADELGTLNQQLAAVCDRVVLVVAGQPLTIKESR